MRASMPPYIALPRRWLARADSLGVFAGAEEVPAGRRCEYSSTPLPPASREHSSVQGLKKYRPVVAGVDNVENEVDYGEVGEHCSVPGSRPPARTLHSWAGL